MTMWFVLNAVVLAGWDAVSLVVPRLKVPRGRFVAAAAMLGITAALGAALP
jgi:hypothetical protein